MQPQNNNKLKVFIADIIPLNWDEEDIEDRMLELENLVNTYGGLVILKKIQKRINPDYRTYIGKGKLEEIKQQMKEEKADILIIGNILKPGQIYNINEALRPIGAKAWDRVDLILKIFERHAQSIEARLQIELASIRHMGPRIFGMGMELSRQGGGSRLARGLGETNTEIMRRHLKEREKKIKDKLLDYKRMRSLHRSGRERNYLETVGIVGYTNAGKSSLMNTLTSKGVLSENKLFATLGTSVGKMYLELEGGKGKVERDESSGYSIGKEILINDTIGFIRDLPPELIDAFSSTLEDSIESKILLHVVDSSDPKLEEKIQVVDDILFDIKAKQPKIYVFNKIDLIDEEKLNELKEKYMGLEPIFISAEKKIGIENLKKRIVEMI